MVVWVAAYIEMLGFIYLESILLPRTLHDLVELMPITLRGIIAGRHLPW
jgi:hypothetical protein